ncbi:MAG TPA: chemotaxis protein CheD [Gemmatimonadaceae bacterium]|jgi:chemotaxis protein CheD|nr:chemotaxis protein CheD [Gemmatimonadaceae bacterium]
MIADSYELRVKVADYAVAADGLITTVGLGSCVAIALYDSVARVGGLAHVLLPDQAMSRDRSNPAKFPATAVPLLVEHMQKLGAMPIRIRAKIAGGASMFSNFSSAGGGGINIGERNVAAVREALASRRIEIVGEDVGSDHGRSVYFHLADGRLEVRSVRKGSRVL